ncbi:MAG: hypothetical protein ABR501_01510 [Pyrinomonadaceae bacterium]
MSFLNKWRPALLVMFSIAIGVAANDSPDRKDAAKDRTEMQDVRNLDRRITSLEQRLYLIESSINRLEQLAFSQRTPISQPAVPDPEINVLRGEMRLLQARISEIECGLVKLDERTTSPAVRDGRRGEATKTADPCRIAPASPLRLSNRP